MNRSEYTESMKRLDKDMRVCIKYLEGMINEKFKIAMKLRQPPISKLPKADFSRLDSKDDSLQKQINGLRKKLDAANTHIQEHDEDKKFLKTLAKRADEVLGEITMLFEDLYDSGYFKEGTRRKMRDEGLIKRQEK